MGLRMDVSTNIHMEIDTQTFIEDDPVPFNVLKWALLVSMIRNKSVISSQDNVNVRQVWSKFFPTYAMVVYGLKGTV